MQKLPSDSLYQLVRSLTKEEKRYFKLYIKGVGGGGEYMRLFDLLEKQPIYNEDAAKRKLAEAGIGAQAFSAHKKYLYPLIIKSLELQHQNDSIEDEILSGLKQVRLLYKRGLHQQAFFKVLQLEKLCKNYDKIYYLPRVQEWHLLIENVSNRYKGWQETDFDAYCDEMQTAISQLQAYIAQRHLTGNSYIMFGLQQTGGQARTEAFRAWLDRRPVLPPQNEHTSVHVWLAYWGNMIMRREALRQGAGVIEAARQIITRLDSEPLLLTDASMGTQYADTALRGMDWSAVLHLPDDFCFFEQAFQRVNKTLIPHYFEVKCLHKQLLHAMEQGDAPQVETISRSMQLALQSETQQPYLPDIIRITAHFSVGTALFYLQQYEASLPYFEYTIANAQTAFSLLYSSARLLLLLVYWERGEFLLLPYSVRALYRALLKDQTLFSFERVMLRRLKHLSQAADKGERDVTLSALRTEMQTLQTSELEREPLLHFHYLAWVESKLQNVGMLDILRTSYIAIS